MDIKVTYINNFICCKDQAWQKLWKFRQNLGAWYSPVPCNPCWWSCCTREQALNGAKWKVQKNLWYQLLLHHQKTQTHRLWYIYTIVIEMTLLDQSIITELSHLQEMHDRWSDVWHKDLWSACVWCVLCPQVPAGVLLSGSVCVLHHQRVREEFGGRPLHSGKAVRTHIIKVLFRATRWPEVRQLWPSGH